ncbi:hypothetical protein S83_008878 [Arachis hypogaea]
MGLYVFYVAYGCDQTLHLYSPSYDVVVVLFVTGGTITTIHENLGQSQQAAARMGAGLVTKPKDQSAEEPAMVMWRQRWKQAPLCGIFIMAGRSSGNWAACAGVLVLVRIFGPSPRPKKQKIIRIVDPFFAIIRFGVHRLQWLRVMASNGSETPSAKAIVGLYGITDSYAKLILFYSRNDNSVCMYELRTWVTIKLASSCLANFVVMSVYYVILVFSCYCSHSLTILASTVISDLKRVNYGSQVGRIVIIESADGTLRTTSIMSNSEYPKLKYSISLEIVHTKLCLNKEKQSTQIELERTRSNYEEYIEENDRPVKKLFWFKLRLFISSKPANEHGSINREYVHLMK